MLTSEQDNFVKYYERSIRTNWELPALTDYGKGVTYTYAELGAEIAKLHLLFQAYGLKKDDKVALIGTNYSPWCITYLATVTYGAIIVPILQDFKPADAMHIINHSESKLLFVSDYIYQTLDMSKLPEVVAAFSLESRKTLCSSLSQKVDWNGTTALLEEKFPNGLTAADVAYDERDNKCVASINYTSGTTGFSKGVITPCNALAGNVKFAISTHQVFQGCRQVAFLPLAHAYGCAIDFLGAIAAGGHVHLFGRTPAPTILMKAFAEVKPTLILSVPLILEKAYKAKILPQLQKAPAKYLLMIPGLRNIVYKKVREGLMQSFGGSFSQVVIGGAALNPEVESFMLKIGFPLTVGYGMTECAPLISYTHFSKWKAQSCGQFLAGLMEAKIIDANEEGIGEIVVKGENTMYGYYKNEEATKATFTEDGWLKTGDLGYVDSEGFIFIKGRNKTMLLGSAGQNIYPEEIEAKLNNKDYIMESVVIQNADQIVALVYPDYEAIQKAGLNVKEVVDNARKATNKEIASYEQIARVKIYDKEFEKTPKRSIKRFLYQGVKVD